MTTLSTKLNTFNKIDLLIEQKEITPIHYTVIDNNGYLVGYAGSPLTSEEYILHRGHSSPNKNFVIALITEDTVHLSYQPDVRSVAKYLEDLIENNVHQLKRKEEFQNYFKAFIKQTMIKLGMVRQ